jgi:hypothetical protein
MILVIAAGLLAASPAYAQVGMKLEEARTGEFWSSFDLQPAGEADSTRMVEFRPGGGPFASLVTVSVEVDGEGKIRAMELAISREMVDDPANGVFARDIAQGFLRASMPADDLPDVEALASEIGHSTEHRHASEGGFAVYEGHAERWGRTLEASTLLIRNESTSRGRTLVLVVTAR